MKAKIQAQRPLQNEISSTFEVRSSSVEVKEFCSEGLASVVSFNPFNGPIQTLDFREV